MKDKVCVVTGSSRGLGEGIAVAFAEAGAKAVTVTYASNQAGAESTAADVEKAGAKAIVQTLEVTDRSSIQACYAATVDAFGTIDVLVNNAGINKQGFMPNVTEADWDEIMDVNLKGPFLCSQEVFPIMEKQQSGRIINIASVSGLYGGPKTIHYAVSKAGLITMTQVFALYGAGWAVSATMSGQKWQWWLAIGGWVGAPAIASLIGTPVLWLGYAAGLVLLAMIPGLILVRQEPAEVI